LDTEPCISLEDVCFGYEEDKDLLFNKLSMVLPKGVTALVGQNGTGKSTLLLLAGARLQPSEGSVNIDNKTGHDFVSEEERNRAVSFIYQNMEFETEELLKEIMSLIFTSGLHNQLETDLIVEIIEVMELENSLNKKLHKCSKGEMQRAILAFSLLYGSPYIMMDEPFFSLENAQKVKVLEYLNKYSAKYKCSIYYSLHEIDLAMKYATNGILFFKDGRIMVGTKEKVLTQKNIEEAYQVPFNTLHSKQDTFRTRLKNPVSLEDLKKIKTQVVE